MVVFGARPITAAAAHAPGVACCCRLPAPACLPDAAAFGRATMGGPCGPHGATSIKVGSPSQITGAVSGRRRRGSGGARGRPTPPPLVRLWRAHADAEGSFPSRRTNRSSTVGQRRNGERRRCSSLVAIVRERRGRVGGGGPLGLSHVCQVIPGVAPSSGRRQMPEIVSGGTLEQSRSEWEGGEQTRSPGRPPRPWPFQTSGRRPCREPRSDEGGRVSSRDQLQGCDEDPPPRVGEWERGPRRGEGRGEDDALTWR